MYSKETNEQTNGHRFWSLDFWYVLVLENLEKERKKKIGPFFKLCLVRMHAFAL